MSGNEAQARHTRHEHDDDDIEAHSEQSPLLGQQADGRRAERRAPDTWQEYPTYAWNVTSSAVASAAANVKARTSAWTGRDKQRQTAGDGLEGSEAESSAAGARRGSKLQQFKQQHPQTYKSLIISAGVFALALFLFLVALLHLIFITLRAPDDATQQRIAQRALAVEGPDKVDVVSVSDNGVVVRIDGRIGLDGDVALDEWLGERESRKWWAKKERSFVEWVVGKVEGVQVDIDTIALRSPDWSNAKPIEWLDLIPDKIDGHDDNEKYPTDFAVKASSFELVTIDVEPIRVHMPKLLGSRPSNANAPSANQAISITAVAKPFGPNILNFAKHALDNKTAYLDIRCDQVRIRGMSAKEWAKKSLKGFFRWGVPGWVNVCVGETWRRVAQRLPKMDGNGTDTDEFLNLTRYDFQELQSGKDRALGLDIRAEATNPIGKLLAGHVGWSLPFGAYLPLTENSTSTDDEDLVLLAAVATEPFDIHGEHKIPLRLHGRVVQPPQANFESGHRAQRSFVSQANSQLAGNDAGQVALSNFLSRFLRGDPNTLIVRGGSPFRTPISALSAKSNEGKGSEDNPEAFPGNGDELPPWLDRALRAVALPIAFPGSKVTDLIQNVSISNLKITPHPFEQDKLVCSGTITGVMNLPGQLATVNVEITDLWPDVLIFNGKPPSMKNPSNETLSRPSHLPKTTTKEPKEPDNGDDPVPDPLPDPLPEHAFGRVVPHTWAPAETIVDPDDPTGQRKLLRSELKNVPFTVLPGRGAEFRSFSWKIVTGEGARAGIDGKAKAKIWNSGLGKLTLSNMPVKGVFTVGKRGSTPGDGDGDGDDGLRLSQ